MKPSLEISLDLTAQQLLAPLSPAGMVEVDDICDVDPALRTGSFEATPPADLLEATIQIEAVETGAAASRQHSTDDSVEIELSAEQISTLVRAETAE